MNVVLNWSKNSRTSCILRIASAGEVSRRASLSFRYTLGIGDGRLLTGGEAFPATHRLFPEPPSLPTSQWHLTR
jgi:hypothetical protein